MRDFMTVNIIIKKKISFFSFFNIVNMNIVYNYINCDIRIIQMNL